MNKIRILGIAFLLIWASCSDTEKRIPNEITGLWKLVSMKIKDAETGIWSHYRGGMQGYLLYDGHKNMTIHLTDLGYEKTDLRFPNFSETISVAALKHLTKSYYYIGEYKILNDSIVQHTRISHSNPGDWGKVVQRQYTWNKDTLIITPTERKLANLELKWVRPE